MKPLITLEIVLVVLVALPCAGQSPVRSAIEHQADGSIHRVVIGWEATPTNSYDVLMTPDLDQPWQVINPAPLLATTNVVQYQDENTLPRRFYQVMNRDIASNMVWIPDGTFLMGSPGSEAMRLNDEGPQTTVILCHGFWMGRFEVTQEKYWEIMDTNPSHFPGTNRPVERVSWHAAMAYCAILTERERLFGRLPVGSFEGEHPLGLELFQRQGGLLRAWNVAGMRGELTSRSDQTGE